jgi:hypothetical protein
VLPLEVADSTGLKNSTLWARAQVYGDETKTFAEDMLYYRQVTSQSAHCFCYLAEPVAVEQRTSKGVRNCVEIDTALPLYVGLASGKPYMLELLGESLVFGCDVCASCRAARCWRATCAAIFHSFSQPLERCRHWNSTLLSASRESIIAGFVYANNTCSRNGQTCLNI